MFRNPLPPRVRTDPEYQSALTRMAIWVFGGIYLGIDTYTGYHAISVPVFIGFFALFFIMSVAVLISVHRQPNRIGRRYLSLFMDLCITSYAVYLTGGTHSPFFLFYIWIFIAYGTRYGQPFLAIATLTSALLYSLVIGLMGEWQTRVYEAGFQLIAIFLLPLYLNSLLKSLHHARLAADAASRAKSEFLANISHEIRTPLHGALGMMSLLKTTPLNEEQQEYITNLSNCARILRTLIDDVLDFSKIEAGKLRLEKHPFDVPEVIQEVVQLLEPLAREKHLPLHIQLPAHLPGPVQGDALRLRQVLLNLVGNAIKFTDRGGVTVHVTQQTGNPPDTLALRFQIEDTGIGIPADQIKHIFESFHQADRSITRLYGGSGLGTSIAYQLVKTMGGYMGVRSEHGKGSTFWFDLRWPLVSGEQLTGIRHIEGVPVITGKQRSNLPVLLAEDSAIGAKAVASMLAKLGIRVHVVTNGVEALEQLQVQRYGLVLMDMHMPTMDGLEATRRWREQEARTNDTTPIVALTANVTIEDRNRCLQAGMNDFLAKPVDIEQLNEMVLRYLAPAAVQAL